MLGLGWARLGLGLGWVGGLGLGWARLRLGLGGAGIGYLFVCPMFLFGGFPLCSKPTVSNYCICICIFIYFITVNRREYPVKDGVKEMKQNKQ